MPPCFPVGGPFLTFFGRQLTWQPIHHDDAPARGVVLQVFLQSLRLPPQPIPAGRTHPVEVDLGSLANGIRPRGLRPVLDQFIHLVKQNVDIIQRFRLLE